MHVFYTPDIDTCPELPEEEAGHCLRVLRLGVGEEVMLTDGKGMFHKARISSIAGKRCRVEVLKSWRQQPFWNGRFHLAIAPTKNIDRMEWMAEKATEIGFDRLSFLNCRFSERKVIKTERIEKIVVAAVKQSLKAYKPVVDGMEEFRSFVRRSDLPPQRYIAHCYEGRKPLLKHALKVGEDAVVLIGPEGDFSPEEVQWAEEAGFISISLGRSRLRTETAGLEAVFTFNFLNQQEE